MPACVGVSVRSTPILTFHCEDTGAGGSASAVDGFAHVFSLVFREGFGQVKAVRLTPINVLIVLTVREHLTLEPPGDFGLGLACDLHCKPHGLGIYHRLVFQGLFEPRSPRPGVIFFIVVRCRAVDDASLVLFLIVLCLP